MPKGNSHMDHIINRRSAASLASEAQLCRLLAAQLSLESEARALLSEAVRLEAALASCAPLQPQR